MIWWTIHKLKSTDWIERSEAAEKLGNSGNRLAIKPLIAALNDDTKPVINNVAKALANIGKPAVKKLIDRLKKELENSDNSWDFLSSVAWILGEIKNEKAVNPLISILKIYNVDEETKSNVQFALKKIGNPSVKPLIEQLKNEDYLVRWRVADTLGIIEDKQAIDPLNSVLKNNDEDVVNTAAAIALDKIDPNWIKSNDAKNTIPGLIMALNSEACAEDSLKVIEKIDPEWEKSEVAKNSIRYFILKLAEWESEITRNVLKFIDPNWEKSEIAKRTIPDLIIRLKKRSDDPQFMEYAANVLAIVGDFKAVEPFLEILENNDLKINVIESHLSNILEKSAEKLDINLLKRATGLKSTTMFYHDRYCGNDSYNYTSDFSRIKQLARQELIRRGYKA